ncbi:flagellar basal-body rod modification protein FlgD [Sulfuritortus calidifontis]|uniref:Basal-body rod modification protein FlgD n=1 Tax=Sulfuritortus calidifontis TaxID=1914471 RepID=A0A4R3JUN8_9PROT|nr:flagellar hook assembly protein FlgD [Sulfuritortus calidifontis]TCS71518.1 flagellar basal-body rod modification protein FlgD [Sulfuritortus calidifontis]
MAVTNTQTSYASLIDSINGQTTKKATANQVTDMQDRFLKLLTTQLQNQDPMNPMENAELTSQLAQMSTVEGITKLNTSLDSLLAGYQASQTMQAAALIGRTVLTEGDTIDLNGGLGAAAFELKSGADKVVVKIQDSNGIELRSLALGQQDAGMVKFGWDGLDNNGQAVADGNYWFVVEAERAGNFVDATPLALTGVRSVVLSNGKVELDTASLGIRQLDQVRQIF